MENLVLNFSDKQPLYRQLYANISGAIRKGTLKAGEKLPSKRRLAQNLSISVNTVDTAYQMLVAEGYINSKPRSGYSVCNFESLPIIEAQKGKAQKNDVKENETRLKLPPIKYNFGTAGIDTSLFPYKTWCNLQREVFAENNDILNHGHRHGDIELRIAISNHLREFRAAGCEPEQIIVGAGMEYLLGLLARMFSKNTFAVENPGYNRASTILKNSGANVININVDESGMSILQLEKSTAKLAYITPSHQFPTGVTMPIARRTALLKWAHAKNGRFIIEDDYNSEFRFDGKPLPALQGLESGENVIYISTFSKSIAPAIRIAYMALPKKLLAQFDTFFGHYSCTVSRFEQQTLYKFIKGGYFARHLARIRTQYKIRRDEMISALKLHFGEDISIKGAHTGLHLVLVTKEMTCGKADYEQKMVQEAAQHGIKITAMAIEKATEDEQTETNFARGLVLGYGALVPGDIPEAVAALKSVAGQIKND